MPLSPGTMLGPYEIVSTLGAGGMGEVYRARDSRLERDVAVKVLLEATAKDPQALARFQREVRAVAMLSHPNLVTIFDFGTYQDSMYAVMELLEGQSLRSRMKQSVLDLSEVLSIASAIAEGLSAAHAKGLVHRDIKPDNIFLTNNGIVKILDFGLVRIQTKELAASAATIEPGLSTEPGVLMGTVPYMSPEQVRGQSADQRTDVFSFGCVVFEMLTGRRPFERPTSADTMAAILTEPPPTLSASGRNRPVELDYLVLRCLEKDPANRFPSARELASALKPLVQQSGASTLLETRGEPTSYDAGMRTTTTRNMPSVAVLPFTNMSSDPENEFFSDGLAEELITSLSKVEGLHVASRTSSFAFKGKNENIRKIGDELKVRTVLQGSVRKSGTRLRISAQLTNVADGFQLWAETYDRQLEDVFAIQDEIAQNIAQALKGILTEKEKQVVCKTAAGDVRAYEFYLRGRQFCHQFKRKSLDVARQMFASAIEIDPSYARAHAGLADVLGLLYLNWEPKPELLVQADTASRKALDLDPNSAEAHVARGFVLSTQKQFAEARKEFDTAIQIDSNLFEAYFLYGRMCMSEGTREQAAAMFEKACKVQPDAYQAYCLRSSIYEGLRRQGESLAVSRQGLQVIQKHLNLHPDDARALYLGAILWCRVGDSAKALEWADKAIVIDPEETMTLYNVACLYALLGESEKSLDCLESSVKHGSTNWRWMENDADFDAIRAQPRFVALMRDLKEKYP
ncbi:MAG: tetratricopeptide repeat protein [Planctomycetes bacterium]|nr:tetratricopeptide repeat protein [Planctomycetota bacterium]